MTILAENHHTFLISEYDPVRYEDADQMVEYVAQSLRQTSREATILLYSPALDPHLQKLAELADRVFCIYEVPKNPAKGRAKAEQKIPKAQVTSGGVLMRFWKHEPSIVCRLQVRTKN